MRPRRATLRLAILALALAGCTADAGAAGTLAVPAAPSASVPDSATPSPAALASSAAPIATSGPTTQPPAAPSGPAPSAPVLATGARLLRATTARSVDTAGNPVGETDLFDSATDRTIILAVAITGGTPGTTVGYRRYFENTFIDGKNTHPTRPGDGMITFSFTKAAGSTYPAGGYLVRVLVDGRDVGTVRFTVR